MPSRIIKKDEVKKMYEPDGLPTVRNQTPDDLLFTACQDGVSMASLTRALDKKANANARNRSGKTPLMYAALNWAHPQYMPFLKKLTDMGAELNVESEHGYTALDGVNEQIQIWEAAREQEKKDQLERREFMEGRGPTGFGYGSAEDQRKMIVWNQPLVDELDTFKLLPQIYEGKKFLVDKGAKVGEAPFNPAYLTDEEFVEKRDKLIAKYKDAKYKFDGHFWRPSIPGLRPPTGDGLVGGSARN
mmetsp:Transcript_73092/g.191608  ORF Transcript_73092/g.191608 Transcript_73092/m.191608 type:complete len:245 (-) Transcript_73092:50-784(-)